MPPIPDTGGGASGFFAHWLWTVFRHVPSSGRWDWLLLLIGLALAGRVLFLPYLWWAVKRDVDAIGRGETDTYVQTALTFGWDVAFALSLAWFFHTYAGQTFLEGRSWIGDTPPWGVQRGLYFLSLIAWAALARLAARLLKETSTGMAAGPKNVYADSGVVCYAFEVFVFLGLHLLYWYWSVASLLIFLIFLATGVVTEVVRVCWVRHLHRRTFG